MRVNDWKEDPTWEKAEGPAPLCAQDDPYNPYNDDNEKRQEKENERN